ncbi:MAG TPA: serine hydrolase domain-containing protein [Candidatus Tumulicola sp.]
MKVRFASLCVALASSCIAGSAIAAGAKAPPSVTTPSLRAAIVAAVEKERKVYGGRTPVPGVLIGVWDAAGGSYVRTFGFADVAAKRALTPADHFRIGSNTKTFVVAVLLQLVDEGKLKLDDPLSRFSIGVKVPNAEKITVRQLCDMRSGLFEAFDAPQFAHMNIQPNMHFDPRTIIGWAVKQKPYFAPGKGYHYSNTNYLILGLIVEALTKHPVGDEIRRRLLEPYALAQTSYPDTQGMPNPWAHGYALNPQKNWKDVSNTIPVSLMGSAGLMISDMADMRRWMKLYVTGKTSSAAMHRALIACVPTGTGNLAFGLGLGCSAGWYGYTGGLPGYNTAEYYFPATGATIVAWVDLQANTPKPGPANAIFRDIARLLTPNNVPFVTGGNEKSSGL